MTKSSAGPGVRAFTSLLVVVAFLGTGWLSGLALRSARAVRTQPVDWPADAAPGLDLGAEADRWAGAPGNHGPGNRAGAGNNVLPIPALHIFGDYECGACLALHLRLGSRLVELAKSGRLRVFYHMAPLSPHWRGALAGEIVYCLPAQGRPAAHERIFEAIAVWTVAADPEAALLDEVVKGPRDMAALRQCVASGAGRAAVERDRALAARLGVSAVPGIFLNGERIEFDSWRSLQRFVERAAAP